jgi:hypothetical protein
MQYDPMSKERAWRAAEVATGGACMMFMPEA